MSSQCVTEICKRKSRAQCHCCSKDLCFDHLKEHQNLTNIQLNTFVDELNTTTDQLLKINVLNVIMNCRQKLDKWYDDCHGTIDRFYKEKCQELQRRCLERVDQKQKEINQMKLKIGELIREDDATYEDIPPLILTINDIKRDVNQFEEKGIMVDVHSLTINKNLVYIEEWIMNNVNISSLSFTLRTIDCFDGPWSAMACNNHFLLFNQYSNLCLMDRQLNVVKQSPWIYSCISDMCWSSTLNNFIITTEKDGVFLVNENLTSIKSIQTIEKKNWFSCMCSDAALFLTTNEPRSNIFQFNLLSSFQLINKWSPLVCHLSTALIHNIAYNNETVALIVEHDNDESSIQLRSLTTLHCFWSLPIDLLHNARQMHRVCSLRADEWLVVDPKNSRLLQISKDGKLKFERKYKSTPHNAVLFGSNILAIRTKTSIDFYKV